MYGIVTLNLRAGDVNLTIGSSQVLEGNGPTWGASAIASEIKSVTDGVGSRLMETGSESRGVSSAVEAILWTVLVRPALTSPGIGGGWVSANESELDPGPYVWVIAVAQCFCGAP